MNGRGKKMYELTIIQRKDRELSTKQIYYFEDLQACFDAVEALIDNARCETEYIVRVIEEGQIEDE